MHHVVAMKIAGDQPEATGKKDAGERAGDGDVEFLLGIVRLARDTRQPSENEKRNGSDWNSIVLGNHAVAELMEDHGSEKKNAGDDAQRPVLGGRPGLVLRGKLSTQGKRDQEKNDDPARVQIDGDSENTSNPEAAGGS